ncbi:MAG TPA: mammalian cell entry protein [Opitutaceae bacterium]|jgi:paraquat-inducible protein B
MKNQMRPSIVGAFVLGAFGLGLIALLSFGGISFLHHRERFVVFFDESIQGLTLGAPVKMSGVTLGRVVDTHVAYNPKQPSKSAVEVTCEFESNVLVDTNGNTVDVSNPTEIRSLIERGLRAQLTVTGFATGLVDVELGFYDPAQYPPIAGLRSASHPDYPVVPAIPSTALEFEESAMAIVTDIRRIDFKQLAANVESVAAELRILVADAQTKLDDLDLKGLSTQWKAAGAAVTSLAGSPQIPQTLDNLNHTLSDVRSAVANVDREVGSNSAHVTQTLVSAQRTLQQFNNAAATLQRFIAAQNGLGDSATTALNQLSSAADAVQRLADFLERNPNALLSGRKPPQR